MKILVLDDSRNIRDRLINLLDMVQGVEFVAQAENAENALLTYHKLRPEVLILDIRMQGENGIEVLKQVKSEQHAPYVIMLTNFPYPQYKKKCFEEGADYFLDKSTEFDEISEIINSLVKAPDSLRRKALSETDRVSGVEKEQNE
jgi:DNA-binding NarL/FixJ family response regulator